VTVVAYVDSMERLSRLVLNSGAFPKSLAPARFAMGVTGGHRSWVEKIRRVCKVDEDVPSLPFCIS